MRNAPMSSEEITYWIVNDIAVHHNGMIRRAVPNFEAAWSCEQCRALLRRTKLEPMWRVPDLIEE